MKDNEVRLGNYVLSEIENTRMSKGIIQLDASALMYLFDVDDDWHRIKPIPLTEQWLEKTTATINETPLAKYFNYFLNESTKISLMLCNDKGKGEFYVMIQQEDEVVSIPRRMFFIHEWQNLYFALTGSELTK